MVGPARAGTLDRETFAGTDLKYYMLRTCGVIPAKEALRVWASRSPHQSPKRRLREAGTR